MNKNSNLPRGNSRAEFVLPNARVNLKLLEIRIVGVNKSDEVISMEILGWLVRDGRSIPITLAGVHEPKEGFFYAIANMDGGAHTDLSDGRQYPTYVALMMPKWAAYEQSQEPAAPEAEPALSKVREGSDPQPWKAVQR